MADVPKTKFTRRGFLKGAGVTAATTAIESANALARETKNALHHDLAIGPEALPVKLLINGHEHSVMIEPRYTLADALRDSLGLTGTALWRRLFPKKPVKLQRQRADLLQRRLFLFNM